jgi:pyruvate formate lyase activating enzyme
MKLLPEKHITRREFLQGVVLLGLYAWVMTSSVGCLLRRSVSPLIPSDEEIKEAEYYSQISQHVVQCQLCFRRCTITEGGRGFCLARENRDGKLYSLTYGKPVAVHIDPIEKEPLFHMEPGSDTLCLGTATCNLRCKNCINWNIAQKAPEDVEAVPMTAQEVVQTAIDNDVPTVCFTYNEPTQQYEYACDIAKLAREKGLKVTFHTNGEMNPEPMKAILSYVDSVAIDLKAFDSEVYRRLTEGEMQPVLDTLRLVKQQGAWLEIVCLIIPTWSDDLGSIEKMCNWIHENLGGEVPVHFSRFFPACQLTGLSPTPISTLEQAHDIARNAGLDYAYISNVAGHQYANTYCPECGKILIERKGLLIQQNNIVDGKCKFCGHSIPGIWTT